MKGIKAFFIILVVSLATFFLVACGGTTKYKLTLEANDQHGEVSGGGEYAEGESVKITATAKAGYEFDGWYEGSGLVSEDNPYTLVMPAKEYNLEAKFVAEGEVVDKWTVEFYDKSKKLGEVEVNDDTVIPTASIPATSKTGYEFKSWLKDSETGSVFNVATSKVKADLKLYARYELVEYTITYNLDGGSEDDNAPIAYNIESDTIILYTPEKAGYDFVGWFDAATGGNEVLRIAKGSTGNKVLFARWEVIEYTITYNLDGGTNDPDNPAKYTAFSNTIILKDPSKEGFGFYGWWTASEGGVRVYNIPKGSNNNVELFARWGDMIYYVTYELDGGTNHPDNPSQYNSDDLPITLANPTKAGYSFESWHVGSLTGEVITTIAAGTDRNLKLYAKFTIIEYNINYEGLDGATNHLDNPETYNINSGQITFKNPTKEHHRFDGWFDAAVGGNRVLNIPASSTGEKTIYARFTELPYSITYNLDGGTNAPANPSEYYNSGSTIVLADPFRAGYTFGGWFDAAEGGNEVEEIVSGSSGDKVLYARWNIQTSNLLYEMGEGATAGGSYPSTYTFESNFTLEDPTRPGYTFDRWEFLPSGSVMLTVGETSVNPEIITINNPTSNFVSDKLMIYNDNTIWRERINSSTFFAKPNGGTETDQWWAMFVYVGADGNVKSFATLQKPANTWVDNNGNTLGSAAVLALLKGINLGAGEYVLLEKALSSAKALDNFTAQSAVSLVRASFYNNGIPLGTTAGDGTFKAHWNINTYSITYNTGDGTNPALNPATYNVETDDITLLDAEGNTGYKFQGWYTEENGAGEKVEVIAKGSYGDKVLYAHWTVLQNYYVVSFNVNGGVGTYPDQSVDENEKAVKPLVNPTRTGYSFDGWFEKVDGEFKQEEFNFETEIIAAVELFAKWSLVDYNITYVLSGGDKGTNPASYTVEGQVLLSDPIKNGFEFDKWILEPNAPTTLTVDGVAVTGSNFVYNNLEQRYSSGPVFVFTYEDAYYQRVKSDIAGYPSGTDFFNGTFAYVGADGVIKSMATLTGSWKYYEAGGSPEGVAINTAGVMAKYAEITLAPGEFILMQRGSSGRALSALTLDSQIVLTNYAREATEIPQGSTGDVTLTALWGEEITYSINYELDGGINDSRNPSSYKISDTPITLHNATKVGYRFTGWYDAAEGGNEVSISEGKFGELTIYAQFEELNIPQLDAPANVRVEDGVIKWDSVEHASSYNVVVDEGTPISVAAGTTQYAFEFGTNFKAYKIEVFAVGDDVDYATSLASSIDYNHTHTLAAPTLAQEGNTLSWGAVQHADSYEISGLPGELNGISVNGVAATNWTISADFYNLATNWHNGITGKHQKLFVWDNPTAFSASRALYGGGTNLANYSWAYVGADGKVKQAGIYKNGLALYNEDNPAGAYLTSTNSLNAVKEITMVEGELFILIRVAAPTTDSAAPLDTIVYGSTVALTYATSFTQAGVSVDLSSYPAGTYTVMVKAKSSNEYILDSEVATLEVTIS